MIKNLKTDAQRDYRQFPAEPGDIFMVRENQMVTVGSHPRCGPGTMLIVLEAKPRDHDHLISLFGHYIYTVLIAGTNNVGRVSWYELQCKHTTKLVTNIRRGRFKKSKNEQLPVQ